MKRKLLLKVFTIISALLISGSMIVNPVNSAASASSLNNDLKKNNTKINSAKKDLEDVGVEKSATLKKIQSLDADIDRAEKKIDKLNKEINNLNKNIEGKETEIAEKQEEYDDNMEKLQSRLIVAYENGNTTYLDVI